MSGKFSQASLKSHHISPRSEMEKFLNTYKLIELNIKIIGHLIFFYQHHRDFACLPSTTEPYQITRITLLPIFISISMPIKYRGDIRVRHAGVHKRFRGGGGKNHKIEINRFSTLFSSLLAWTIGNCRREKKNFSSNIAKHSTINSFLSSCGKLW